MSLEPPLLWPVPKMILIVKNLRLFYFSFPAQELHYRETLILPTKTSPDLIIDRRGEPPCMQFPSFVRNSGDQGQISPPLQPSPSYGDNEHNNNTGR